MIVAVDPSGVGDKLALGCATFGRDDFVEDNGAHLGGALPRNGVGVVPEIEAVDVAVVEPEAVVVWMVGTLTGARCKRPTARNVTPSASTMGRARVS